MVLGKRERRRGALEAGISASAQLTRCGRRRSAPPATRPPSSQLFEEAIMADFSEYPLSTSLLTLANAALAS